MIEKQVLRQCFHCGETTTNTMVEFDEKQFCCNGCKTVFQILNQNGLCTYYQLNNNPGQSQKNDVRPEKFAFLEDAAIRSQLITFTEGNLSQITFYLPQIHCSSCLWLLENLHQLHHGISSSRVDFAHKEVAIGFFEKEISLKALAELLTKVGYEPYISLNELNRKPKKYYNNQRIYRLGVAGFCFANIMMLSFPEYLSLVDNPEQLRLTPWFRYINLLLALPVIFYSAREFFVQGVKGLRSGFLNIDAPIALAILITFCRSLYEITTGAGAGFLDSMSGIVFFMLIGRVLQDRTQQSLTFDRDYTSYFPIAINRLLDGKEVPTPLPDLRSGDTIKIYNHEIVPADGMLLRGVAAIDYSFVTGESVPVEKKISELIYAGGRQMGGAIELLLVKDVSQSYLTSLWNKASKNNEKEGNDSFIHPLARYFTAALFTLTGLVGVYWQFANPVNVWPAVTAMLIVACPCTLLLSATFTNGHVVRAFDKAGCYLKNYGVIEKLLSITHIVFDKTGTITNNQSFNVSYSGGDLNNQQKHWLTSVAAQSQHPLSKAVVSYLQKAPVTVDNFKEIPGKGVEAWIEDRHIVLGSPDFVCQKVEKQAKGAQVAFKIDNEVAGIFFIKNQYREGLKAAFAKLSKLYPLSVVSGDNDAERETLQTLAGSQITLRFGQTPSDKLAYVQQLQKSGAKVLMIGDGLNDAAAIDQSDAGIAVSDNINNFSPACDAIMEAGKLVNLPAFLTLAKRGRQTIIASFIVSILYNVIGLYFAGTGQLTPLIAAILMPSSSISILLLTWLGVSLSNWWLIGRHLR